MRTLVIRNLLPILLFSTVLTVRAQDGAGLLRDDGGGTEYSAHKFFADIHRDFDRDHPYERALPGISIIPKANILVRLRKEVFGYLPYWFRDRWGLVDYGLLSSVAYFSGEAAADGSIGNTMAGPNSPEIRQRVPTSST